MSDRSLTGHICFTRGHLNKILTPTRYSSIHHNVRALTLHVSQRRRGTGTVTQCLLTRPLIGSIRCPKLPNTNSRQLTTGKLGNTNNILDFRIIPNISPTSILGGLRVFQLTISLNTIRSLTRLPYHVARFRLPQRRHLGINVASRLIHLTINVRSTGSLVRSLKRTFSVTCTQCERHRVNSSMLNTLAPGIFT